MPTQLDITLLSYAAGLVSGICFCVGTAFSSVVKMADLCEMRWDYSPAQAEGLALQSSQYLTGALFLLASFGLQVVAALIESSPVTERTASFILFLFALSVFGFVAYWLQRHLYKHRKPKLITELDRRKNIVTL
jgi:hypothetical protein